jgi:ABC-2 type transport system permease protein
MITAEIRMHKYRAAFLMGVRLSLEYRANLLLSMASTVLPVVMQVYLWRAVYAKAAGSSMYGYTFPEMMVYAVMAGLVAKIVATGFEYEINDDIKNGGLNAYLVRPVGYALYRLCRFLGERCLYVLVVLCASLITLLVMSALLGLIVRYDQVLGFSGILCLSVVLNYFIYFLVGMSAIWIGDASRLFGTINIVLIVASGGIFPLDIFGDTVAKIVHLLPFVYTIQFPIDALCGRLGRAEGYAGVAIEVCWIGLLIGMAALTWHRGMRRYAAVGG